MTISKELFLVERHGVYQQGTFGIYSTLPLAVAAFQRAKSMERDNYHSFAITRRVLDQDIATAYTHPYEDEVVAVTSGRDGALVWQKGWELVLSCHGSRPL